MNINIRLARETDVPAITEIYNQAIALGNATAHTSTVTEAARQRWLAEEHPPETEPVFVAETDDEVIGYYSLSAYRPGRAALRHTKEISYYVHEDFRGLGIGSNLIEHAIEVSTQLGIKTLFGILLDNNPASVALLKKHDFKQWGYMPDVADFDGNETGHLYYGLRIPTT